MLALNINTMTAIQKMMAPETVSTDTRLHVDIDIPTNAWYEEQSNIEALSRLALEMAWKSLDYPERDYEVSLVLGDDEMQRALNSQYLGKDTSTNVLSFPSDETDTYDFPLEASLPLGDIIVAFETVKRECEQEEVSFSDHFCHLVVHGMLHLAGFDHISSVEAEAMEALEIDILSKLGINNPYADGILLDHG